MGKMNVTRSIEINSSKAKVKNIIADFHHWDKWSPWLITDPNANVEVEEDGKFFKWTGKRTGSGEMTISSESENRVEYKLQFLKPWKSKADVKFDLNEKDGKTTVDWHMKRSMPFFLFFMTKKMEAYVGMDYERGLKMLKEYAETGHVRSKLEFLGEQQYPGTKFIGLKRKVALSEMPKYMSKDFEQLMNYISNHKNLANQEWFAQYHKFDLLKDQVEYTAGVGVIEYPDDVPTNWLKSEIPTAKMNTVRHIGPYDHIGNAWGAAQSMIQAKEFKPKKGFHPIEFYRNSPQEVAPEALISDISFAVK